MNPENIFAVVDLETTGGDPLNDRIIECAIIVTDGNEIIETYQTMVDPGIPIPGLISRITNITDDMLIGAPSFHQVAHKILELTEKRIFVAHNVNFDYNFLVEEFRNLNIHFERKHICSYKSSRAAFKGISSYSLKNLTSELGIKLHNAHRAFDDAMATTELLKKIIEELGDKIFEFSNDYYAVPDKSPLSVELIKSLPNSCGLYWYLDGSDNIIHVNKGRNIKKKIISQLNKFSNKRYRKLNSLISTVQYEITGSYTLAKLKEIELIKQSVPRFNRTKRTLDDATQQEYNVHELSEQQLQQYSIHTEAGPDHSTRTLFVFQNDIPVGYHIADIGNHSIDQHELIDLMLPISPSSVNISIFKKIIEKRGES